jgi:hypothetical protein
MYLVAVWVRHGGLLWAATLFASCATSMAAPLGALACALGPLDQTPAPDIKHR